MRSAKQCLWEDYILYILTKFVLKGQVLFVYLTAVNINKPKRTVYTILYIQFILWAVIKVSILIISDNWVVSKRHCTLANK